MTMLVQYYKPKKYSRKKGVFMVYLDGANLLCFGFSLCNLKEDRFDSVKAKTMAFKRANRWKHRSDYKNLKYEKIEPNASYVIIPESIKADFIRFIKRAFAYFNVDDSFKREAFCPQWISKFSYDQKIPYPYKKEFIAEKITIIKDPLPIDKNLNSSEAKTGNG